MATLSRMYMRYSGYRNVSIMRRYFCNNGNNESWIRTRFTIPQDTRIVPQILFSMTTFIFSIIALRMSYVGFYWAEERATSFNGSFGKICGLLEKQQEREKGKQQDNITIETKSDNIHVLEKELWQLIEKHYDYDKHDIKCKI